MACAHDMQIRGRLAAAGVEVVMCGRCAKILRIPRRLNRKPNRSRRTKRTDFGRYFTTLGTFERGMSRRLGRRCLHERQVFEGRKIPCAWPTCDEGIGGSPVLVVAEMPPVTHSFSEYKDEPMASRPSCKVYFEREWWRAPGRQDFPRWSEPKR